MAKQSNTTHIPAANAVATVTISGVVEKRIIVETVCASLALSGGSAADGLALQIKDDATVIFTLPVETDQIVVLPVNLIISQGSDCVVCFSDAGGASTREAVNVTYRLV